MSVTPLPGASEFRSQKPSKNHTIRPIQRQLPSDIVDPNFKDLVDLALLRVFDAALLLDTRPARLFPTAETVYGEYFSQDDWLLHGDLESEMGRMSYTLSNLPERRLPTECVAHVRFVLLSPVVLTAWEQTLPLLGNKITEETRWVLHMMQKQQRLNVSSCPKLSLITIPVDYRTNDTASHYAVQLWEESLLEVVVQIRQGHFEHAKAFLQIFAFLKDPLGGLESVFDKAVDLFVYMMMVVARAESQLPGDLLPQARWHAAAAQAAQEALFLACPLLEHISYIHFTGHQQLPYVYVALDQLPRSEFSIPEHVLRIVEEILITEDVEGEGSCPIAPISVSSYTTLPVQQGKQMTVIIDGNHRATATMLLRLIAEHPCSVIVTTDDDNNNNNNNNNNNSKTDNKNSADDIALDAFCTDHALGPKWKIDLADVLHSLLRHHDGRRCATLIRSKMDLVRRFGDVRAIPALVVREDNFHTVCRQRAPVPADAEGAGRRSSRPRLLLPIHQALYNDEKMTFALPQAGQVHGRAVGFRPMPLLTAHRAGKGSE